MSFMSKKKSPMVFSTSQSAEYLGISPHTLRRYCKILGIHPRKMYGVKGRFYLYPELVQVMRLKLPDERLYRKRVLDRYEAMKQAGIDKLHTDVDEV